MTIENEQKNPESAEQAGFEHCAGKPAQQPIKDGAQKYGNH